MAIIKQMDELLANKISAGEVVERCSSVVKELVENSIDAKATEIKIELIEAGTKEIKVVDNGIGMDNIDAVMAFNRHATSKVIVEEDLYNINTLGFRGEALASIASVSDITLKTCKDEIGTKVVISGGKLISVENSDSRIGTEITVANLFYNTPARLKHLKSLYTELSSITDYVNKIALSHPEIKFVLSNNNNILLNTDGSNNLLKTIKSIFGIEVAKKMLDIDAEDDDYHITGYVSLPEVHRSSRNNMVTLVNGRVVRNAEVNKAINDSYHSYKPDNRYPITVINIELDPNLVDVNIHPTKMDVKFSKLEELLDLIYKTIRNRIKPVNLIPHIEEKVEFETREYVYNSDFIEEKEITETPKKYEEIKLDFNIVKEEAEEYYKEPFPELSYVGVVHGTYIICQNDKGMYMIDQHAAKERINYEKYKKLLGNPSNESISLLFPITIELPVNEYITLRENFDILENMNFEIEEFGINSVIIKRHPTWLPRGYEEEAVRKIIETVISYENKFDLEKFNESVATMMSCKLAIKANEFVSEEEIEELLKDLKMCDNPFNCPHGRPTIIFHSNYDLEKMFKRSGF